MHIFSLEPQDISEAPQQKATLENNRFVEALKGLSRDLNLIRVKVEQQLSSSETSEEWNQMGHITDRLLFVLYILFISVSFITIVIMWAQSCSPL